MTPLQTEIAILQARAALARRYAKRGERAAMGELPELTERVAASRRIASLTHLAKTHCAEAAERKRR